MPNDVINTITIGNTTYDIGGSGHTIEKSDGTDMTQRANLQFVDATVTDDSTNNRTKIENVKTITSESELDNLPDGIYIGLTDEGLPFDAGDIPYDNTESDLTATDVQGAIDELDDAITTDESTLEGNPINFSTLSAQNAESTILSLEPIQDLHGYDKPWVGGAGKNLCPLVLDQIKTINTLGVWNGNKYTVNNVEFNIEVDADDNIISITVNRISNSSINSDLYIGNSYSSTSAFADSGTYTFSVNTSNTALFIGYGKTSFNTRTSRTETVSDGIAWMILRVNAETNVTNEKVYPILCLSTALNPTVFEPYENICPISGRSEIGILGCGKNCLDNEFEEGRIGPNGNNMPDNTRRRSKNFSFVDGGQTYILSKNGVALVINVARYDKDKNFIRMNATTNGIITLENNTRYIRIYGTPEQITSGLQFELGSQATDYSPYTESTDLTISLGQTVYGGTLDVENGVLVVDRIKLNASDIISGFTQYNSTLNRYISFVYGTNNSVVGDVSQVNSASAISNICDCDLSWEQMSANVAYPNTIGVFHYTEWNYTRIYIYFGDSSVTTQQEAETYLTNKGVELSYELATPIEIQLTPHQISLLQGVNNISTTGDKITLIYRDGKIATLKDIKDSLESSKPVYSTVETVIGTYLNKPLYSKTYQVEFSSSNSYYFDVPSEMDIKFVFGGVYSTRFDFIPFGYGGSGGDMVQCYRFSDTQFRIQNAYYASRMYCEVTLQYTKSTD